MDYLILSKDTVVAKWENDYFTVLNDALLPLYLKNTQNVRKWLETRAIDCHRAHSRLLKKALRLTEKDDLSTVLAANAATITDNYWVKPIDSDLTYSDVRFDNDYFSSLALTGSYDSFNRAANQKSPKTPELTNTGSFEKCWKLHDGKWQMYKKANHEEMFSEIFIYKLGLMLNFNMAEYERGKGIVKTNDFTDNASVNFENAYSFMGDNEDYIDTVNALKGLCPAAIGDYVKMIFLDTICANPDRHTFNFGLLRDADNGEILGLAPNFDNNMALISRGYPDKRKKRDKELLVKLFNELTEYDNSLKAYIPDLSAETVKSAVKAVGMRVRTDDIVKFIMSGYDAIIK